MPHKDPRVLQARGERAWQRKRPWHGIHVDVWNLCAPGLSPYSTGAGNAEMGKGMVQGSQGQPRHQLLYDSTLAGDIEDHANHMVHEMFPAGRDWGEMSAGPLLGEDQGDMAVERAIAETKRRLYAQIHASNFQLAVNMMVFDGCVSGTGCMKIGASQDASTLLDFEAINQAQVAFEPGPRHSIWGFYRKLSETRDMIRVLWPGAELPPESEEPRQDALPLMHDILECTTYDPDEGQWHYDVLLRAAGSEMQRIYERDYVVSPWIAWRYFLHPGEVQGRSRAMSAAPHARVANHAVRVRLQSASIRVNGMWTFRGDDSFNPETAHFQSGALIQVGSNDSQDPTIRPMELPGDPQLGEIILADERQVIHERTLQVGLPEPTGAVRSATEIIERQRDHMRKLGQPFLRLVEEVGRPTLRAVAYLMSEAGQLPELEALRPAAPGQVTAPPLMLDGRDVKVVFNSPMSQAQRLSDAESMVRFGEMAPIVGGPAGFQSAVKGEESVAILAEKMSYPPEAVYSQREREALAEDARQAAMAQAMGPPEMGGMQPAAMGGAP